MINDHLTISSKGKLFRKTYRDVYSKADIQKAFDAGYREFRVFGPSIIIMNGDLSNENITVDISIHSVHLFQGDTLKIT